MGPMQGEASGAPLEVSVSIVSEFQGERLPRMAYFSIASRRARQRRRTDEI